MDSQYRRLRYTPSTREHRYGKGVHLISDPYLLTRLARLCSPECVQPEINRLMSALYRAMAQIVVNQEFPRVAAELPTRMAADHPKEAVYAGEVIDPDTRVVLVGLARAGTLPAMELFEMLTSFLRSERVRVDHVFINRSTDDKRHVVGAPIGGSKIGGPVDQAIVIVPDPMGATGSSLVNVLDMYARQVTGKPARLVALNLIVTPEYIRKVRDRHPDTVIYALRLDRGFSSKKALDALPGEIPKEEKGLNEQDYIVPGGGGFGEISNNAYV
jgi:uracil phosphoribosyltransferase